MSLSKTIRSLQGTMRKDVGVAGDAQRIEQLGWILFFKIFSDLEEELILTSEGYESPIPDGLRWASWADSNRLGKDAPTGEELLQFVDSELFPTIQALDLAGFKGLELERAALLRGVFEDSHNFMKSGTLLRQIIDKVNSDIDFNSAKTRHVFGEIYETILRDLQSAGNAGEFYTPRAVTQFAVEMVEPMVGEVILDPASGTGGFLTGAYEHVKSKIETTEELRELQHNVRGIEKKPLPHLLGVTNLMVHGVASPSRLLRKNSLARPLRDYGPEDQVDVILTNPPFGGTEVDGIKMNFPADLRTSETADLFLMLIVELLKPGGRGVVVLPDGNLSTLGVQARIKQHLLSHCRLHTLVRLPAGVFNPYTPIKTNLLFFEKGHPTEEVWYYEVPVSDGRKQYTKTRPIHAGEFDACRRWWSAREEGEWSWRVSIAEIEEAQFSLDFRNPAKEKEEIVDPVALLEAMLENSERVQRATNDLVALGRKVGL
jgi:type I restriction enzyme M protein